MSRTTVIYKAKGPYHIHSLRSSCFIKKSAFNVAGNLVMVVKFTFQSVFGNSLQNPRHFSARGREESLELYSILWSDWPTSKQEVLRHGNRFAARVRRRYFLEGEKRRPEMRLLFAGYVHPNPFPPKSMLYFGPEQKSFFYFRHHWFGSTRFNRHPCQLLLSLIVGVYATKTNLSTGVCCDLNVSH